MSNKRVLLGSSLALLICVTAFFALRTGNGSESIPASTNRIAQLKKLLEPPIAPERLKRSMDVIYSMAKEGQTQELLEAATSIEAMKLAEPEVWGSLGFALMFTTANIHREDMEWRWKWVRQSLITLRKGVHVTGGISTSLMTWPSRSSSRRTRGSPVSWKWD